VTRIASEVWAHLERSIPTGDNLTARSALSNSPTRLQCAIDSEGHRHFLIELHMDEHHLRDTQSRGLVVVTRDLVVRGAPVARYLDVQCVDIAGHEAFDLIGGELVTELSRANATPEESVRRILGRWRRFWGQLPSALLTREEQLGLFGELWFLLVWLYPAVGLAEAVRRWQGPFGARHDFQWAGKSVEAKATTSSRGHIHRINGIDQLLPPEGGELLLFSLSLHEEAGATNTLSSIINAVSQQLGSEADTLSRFETGLVQAGYSSVHDEAYSKMHLRVVEEGLYVVRDNFPRLTEEQFHAGVPSGIERVEYEINLNTFNHLRIARSFSDGTGHLA